MLIDLFTVLWLALAFYWGYSKGVVYALISWIGLFVSGILSLRLAGLFADKLDQLIGLNPNIKMLVGFILLFFLLVLAVRLFIFILDKILKSFSLEIWNKIAGGLLYMLIILFFWSELLWYVDKWSNLLDKQEKTSHVYGAIQPIAPVVLTQTASWLPVAGKALSEIDSMAVQAKNQLSE